MAKAPKNGMSEREEDDMSGEDEAEVEIEVSVPLKKAKGGMVKAAKKAPAKSGKVVKNYSRISRPQKFSGIF